MNIIHVDLPSAAHAEVDDDATLTFADVPDTWVSGASEQKGVPAGAYSSGASPCAER